MRPRYDTIRRVTNPDRLTGLDASFLALEDGGAHMHVGSVLRVRGRAARRTTTSSRRSSGGCSSFPRYRQKLAFPPLVQSRPVWVDDPHFNPGYHVRHTALPAAGGRGRAAAARRPDLRPAARPREAAVGDLARRPGRRRPLRDDHQDAPLPGRRRLRRRHRHGAVRPRRRPAAAARPGAVVPAAGAERGELLADALVERAHAPLEFAGAAVDAVVHPRHAALAGLTAAGGLAAIAQAGIAGAPRSPLNLRIGPHRRFAWVDADLGGLQGDQERARRDGQRRRAHRGGGRAARATTSRTGSRPRASSSRRWCRSPCAPTAERGALGNRVTTMYAPLPIGLEDPLARFGAVHEAMRGLKESGQAVGAEVITSLADFAPPTILAQAARLQAVQRFFNLTVTNVPGPQFPLYLLGRPLRRDLPAGPAGGELRARHRDHVLRRADRLRARRRLRRAARPRRRSRPGSRRRSRSSRSPRPGTWRRPGVAAAPPSAPRIARRARSPDPCARPGRRARRRPRRQRRRSCASRSPARATRAPSSCCSPSWC